MLGRPESRRRAIHSPCDNKPLGLVTEWVALGAPFKFAASARGFWTLESTFKDQINPKRQTADPLRGSPELAFGLKFGAAAAGARQMG